MDGHAKSRVNQNDALSQSYIQGVERIAQQSNEGAGFSFNLPPEVIEGREKAWSSFFDKYADEASDEVELNIKTMKPVINEDSDDKDEDDDGERREYYSKCKAPIRKLPALIQYWVDTGNPPYQLTGEEDHSETGSSLSEGEYSRSRQSAVLRESIENPRVDEMSPYSSVDTAAYVLSNANVTKKAQTQEIVEGAKRSDERSSAEIPSANVKDADVPPVVDGAPIPLDDSHIHDTSNLSQSQEAINSSVSQGSSVMLSEVLPALQQFDELLEKSKQLKPSRSALSKVRRIRKPALVERPKVAEPASTPSVARTQKNSLDLSENGVRKTGNLRKLYTGRSSPMDLIVARTSTESTVTTGPNSHPALEPEDSSKSQVPSFVSRARARRKRKRAALRQSTAMSMALSNVSQESQELVSGDGNNNNRDRRKSNSNEVKEGHERYTDFFESLGLTPSKTIIGKDEGIGSKPSARRRIVKRKEKGNERASSRVTGQESADSSMKESQDSSQNLDSSPETVSDAANNGPPILGNKVLSLRVERLSEECLRRYGKVKGQSTPCDPNDKKNFNIELLTTMTHDSDSSTILICSCNPTNNYQSSDSDCSLFTQSVNRSTSESLPGDKNSKLETSKSASDEQQRTSESTSQVSEKSKPSSASIETISKPFGIATKFIDTREVVVRLEKLPLINELPNVAKSTHARPDVPSNEIRRASPRRTLQTSSPVARALDAFDSPELMGAGTKCVTIGSRVFGETSQFEASESKRGKPSLSSIEHSFEMCLDDDDDGFAKLVQEFGSAQRGLRERSKKGLNETERGTMDEEVNGASKVQEEINPRPFTRSRGVVETASSLDEEDDVKKINRISKHEGRLKRTLRRIDRKPARDLQNGARSEEKVMERVEDLTNDDKAIVGSKNRLKKPLGRSSSDKVSTASTKTYDFRRSVRANLPSTGRTRPNDPTGKPKRLENIFGTTDEAGSKNSLDELRNARTRSNSGRRKRKRVPHDETNADKRSRITRSARFHTLLNLDTDSYSENKKSVITRQRRSTASQPSNRTAVSTEDISTDPKITVDRLSDAKGTGKSASRNLDDPISESASVVAERNEKSSKSLSSYESSRKDSMEELNILHSRRRKKKEESSSATVARRRGRRTRILGTPIESESDDDDGRRLRKNSNDAIQSGEDVQSNEKKLKCLPDRNVNENDSGRAKRPRHSKSLFSNIFDDMIEDVDSLFSGNGDCQVAKNDRVTRNSNLGMPEIRNDTTNTRESTITFRTRLTSVSDDENVL